MMSMEELFYGPYEQTRIVHSQRRRRRRNGRKSNKNHGECQACDHDAEPPPPEVQTVLFMMPICCDKWERKVKKQLHDLDDVESVVCDYWKQQVSVTSPIDPEKLLKRLQKIKQLSTFWPL